MQEPGYGTAEGLIALVASYPHSPVSYSPTTIHWPYLVYRATVHPLVWVSSMLLWVEVEDGERGVELFRPGVVERTHF